ncbi:hypothetical protein KCU67_g6761, partial [Aureobasidium melanogenum]
MADVVATGLVEVDRVLVRVRRYHVLTLAADLELELNRLKAHLMQLANVSERILNADDMRQLPLAIVGNFLQTLDKCDQALRESTFEETQLLKVVERFALHNAKLKRLLPPKPDVYPTSIYGELYDQYLEAELSRQNTGTQLDYGRLPSVLYVTDAFRGTDLDDVTSTETPAYYLKSINALDLFCLLRTQRNQFPMTLPNVATTVSLVRAYSWGLAHLENDQSLENDYILRARLTEPASASSFGLKQLSSLDMQLEFRNRSEYKVNLQKVVLSPMYALRPDSSHLRVVISNGTKDSHQDLLSLCFERALDLETFQNALTGYERVYHGEQCRLQIMPFAKTRLTLKHTKTYMGSLQLWTPKNLSTPRDLQKTNKRTVQEIGFHRAQNQGTSRMEPQPSLLIFMGQDDQDRSFIFRIVLSLDMCRLEDLQPQTRHDRELKIIPKSSRHGSFEIHKTYKCKNMEDINLAIMGMFQQQRKKERERLEVAYVELRRQDLADLNEFRTTVQELQLDYALKIQKHKDLVARDMREANMQGSSA